MARSAGRWFYRNNNSAIFTFGGALAGAYTADKLLLKERLSIEARKIENEKLIEASRLNNDTAARNERIQRMISDDKLKNFVHDSAYDPYNPLMKKSKEDFDKLKKK